MATTREPSQPARQAQVEQSPLYSHKPHEEENPLDAYEVCPSRVRLGALIGSGAFGRVHAAELLLPGGSEMVVAAKMLNEDALPEEMSDFLREIVMLKRVGTHKHVIRLVACCTQRAPFMALLEHAPRGDLHSLRTARARIEKYQK
ncbi:Fibroblast growth factor receptor homolog 2 [Eumeta japonica]|uniref:Fibroblast growth factor receptor homolog 2 n=1 Tax=Eumeta variegata TaxID=151549 RepID=A0A4C1U5T3_EUMVA|nr:Fibroblast growth factor receptor homolog 2 [Eumeta japonica]